MTQLQRQQAHNFHIYLNETLIPDLKDDGHIETAKDFRKAASYIEQLLRLSEGHKREIELMKMGAECAVEYALQYGRA
jgi:hypothetical protein